MARNLGKMLSGSVSVKTMVVSSGTARPEMSRAFPAANSRAPLIGKSGHCRPPRDAGADRSAVVERRVGSEMKGVDGAGPVALPPGRDPRPQLPVGVELDQVV